MPRFRPTYPNTMSPSLSVLPTEVITEHLLPLLEPIGVIEVVLGLNVPVTRQIYHMVFHDNTHFQHYTRQMFISRVRARPWVIGRLRKGCEWDEEYLAANYERVRVSSKEESDSEYAPYRMHTPWKIECKEGPVIEAAISEQFVGLLNSRREASLCWLGHKGGSPFPVEKVRIRQDSADRRVSPVWELDPRLYDVVAALQAYFNSLPKKSCFSKLDGQFDLTGLDENGLLWLWQAIGSITGVPAGQGVPYLVYDKDSNEIVRDIFRIRNGDAYHAVFSRSRGIVVYKFIGGAHARGRWESGFVCVGHEFLFFEGSVVPGTEDGILDCAFCNNMLILLSTEGTVSWIDLHGEEFEEVEVPGVNRFGPFIQMDSCMGYIVLLSAARQVVLVHSRRVHTVKEIKEFRNLNIVSVAAGKHHLLGLTETGDVYSWGWESFSGCLGLGPMSKVKKNKNVKFDGCSGISVKVPIKMDLPGKAYAIFAGSDRSGFLLCEEEKGKRGADEEIAEALKRGKSC